jgi:hypothetical protein
MMPSERYFKKNEEARVSFPEPQNRPCQMGMQPQPEKIPK